MKLAQLIVQIYDDKKLGTGDIKIFYGGNCGAATLSIMTLSITTLSIRTVIITTVSIMILSIIIQKRDTRL